MSGLLPIAGQSVYLILPPSFPEIQFTETRSRIIVDNFDPANPFITNVTVNGRPVVPSPPSLVAVTDFLSGVRIGYLMISFRRE